MLESWRSSVGTVECPRPAPPGTTHGLSLVPPQREHTYNIRDQTTQEMCILALLVINVYKRIDYLGIGWKTVTVAEIPLSLDGNTATQGKNLHRVVDRQSHEITLCACTQACVRRRARRGGWCPWRDSNPQSVEGSRFSGGCVYQFRHRGAHPYANDPE